MSKSASDPVGPANQMGAFGQPPDCVTEPCLIYMARIMELREFISFYFAFVETSAELGKRIPQDKRVLDDGKASRVLTYSFSEHRQFFNEVILSRAVESFDLYVTTILRDIFLSKPDLLRSEGKVDVATIVNAASYDDLIWQVVEKRVLELSYSSLSELRQYILSRTNVDLFPNIQEYNMALVASEIRNLIAHNDCRVNDVFNRKIGDVALELNVSKSGRIQIDDDWVRRASYTLDGIVFRFDQMVAQKYDIRTLNRMSSFVLRG